MAQFTLIHETSELDSTCVCNKSGPKKIESTVKSTHSGSSHSWEHTLITLVSAFKFRRRTEVRRFAQHRAHAAYLNGSHTPWDGHMRYVTGDATASVYAHRKRARENAAFPPNIPIFTIHFPLTCLGRSSNGAAARRRSGSTWHKIVKKNHTLYTISEQQQQQHYRMNNLSRCSMSECTEPRSLLPANISACRVHIGADFHARTAAEFPTSLSTTFVKLLTL